MRPNSIELMFGDTNFGDERMNVRIARRWWVPAALACLFVMGSVDGRAQQPADSKAAPTADPAPAVAPAPERDGVLPGDRAWEYQHYRVRIWICSDGSAQATDIQTWLTTDLKTRSEVLDASGWECLIQSAPNPWNFRCAANIDRPENLRGLATAPELTHDDKLIVVSLAESGRGLECRVREFDLLTLQWGALLEKNIDQVNQADQLIFPLIRTAFMPLARVDRVTDTNFAVLRLRAINSCYRVRLNEKDEWIVEPNQTSPVYVRADDRFLPILRRTDKQNKLDTLDPIPFTFLTIAKPDEIPEPQYISAPAASGESTGATPTSPDQQAAEAMTELENSFARSASQAMLWTKIQSSARAVLSGRTSKRLQKLALVIRPPTGSTTLRLVSSDKQRQPMEGIEVFSRPLDAPKDAAPELIGKTDWRGLIEIPPSEQGVRMVLLRRGTRPLRQLPIMPGLYPLLETQVPNDEARLNAEGVIKGMRNEILDLVANREVLEAMITSALEAKNIKKATELLDKYQQLPLPQQLRGRMTDDETRLTSQAKDAKERDYIGGMFDDLRKVLSDKVGESKETEIRQRIQTYQNEAQGTTQQ